MQGACRPLQPPAGEKTGVQRVHRRGHGKTAAIVMSIASALGAVGCAEGEGGERMGDAAVLEAPGVYRAQLEAMLGAGQPTEGANAWDEVMAALDAMKTVRAWSAETWDPNTPLSEDPMTSADEMRFDPLVMEDRKPGIEFLRRVEEAGVWAALDEARAAPRRIAPFAWDAANGIGNASEIQLRIARDGLWVRIAGAARMRMAHVQQDDAAIPLLVRRLITFADVVGAHPDALVANGSTIDVMGIELMAELVERPWSAEVLAAVNAELARMDPLPSPRVWLEAMPVVERFLAATDPKSYAESVGDTQAFLAAVDGAVALALKQIDAPVAERERPGAGFMERMTATMMATKHMGDDLEARMAVIPAAERMVGTIETHLNMRAQSSAMIAGLRAAIAAERYRLAQGMYPETIGAVVPEFLAEIPQDPITGGAIGYRRIENDAHGRGYLVYSVGPDGKDDGGRAQDEDPMFGMMSLEAGYDFVINRPRRVLTK